MPPRDTLADTMKKAEQDYHAQREHEERRAVRHERLASLQMWFLLIVLVVGAALATIYRERVSTVMTSAYSAIFHGDKVSGETKGKVTLPQLQAIDKAKQTIGSAKAVNDDREKLLNDINPEKTGAPANP